MLTDAAYKLTQTSQGSLQEVGVKFGEQLSTLDAKTAFKVAGELLVFIRGMLCQKAFGKSVCDPTRQVKDRQKLAKDVFKTVKPEQISLDVVNELIAKKWSSEEDFQHAICEFIFSVMIVSLSQRKGMIEKVSKQIFELSEMLIDQSKTSSDVALVREFLSSETKSVTGRFEMLDTIIGKSALPETVLLAKMATIKLDGARFVISLRKLSIRIAEVQNRVYLRVTSATELNAAQEKRLEDLMEKKYNREVQLNIVVDEAVLGGLKIEAKDTVFDATILGKFNNMQSDFEAKYRK